MGCLIYLSQISSWCIVTGNNLLYFGVPVKETVSIGVLLRKGNESNDLEINPVANLVASNFFGETKLKMTRSGLSRNTNYHIKLC